MSKPRSRSIALALTAAAFVAATAVPTSAGADPEHPTPELTVAVPEEPGAPEDTYDDVSKLTLPPISAPMLEEANTLAESFNDDPQVASVGVALDRTAIEMYWYGDRAERLEAAIASTSSPISVLDSEYAPASLRAAADQLRDGAAGVAVASVYVQPDGSGLNVALAETPQAEARRSAVDVADREDLIEEFDGVPVTFSGAPEQALSRQSDTAHIAGARIYQFASNPGRILNGCTSAFAVIRPETGVKGQLTAAHCGEVGSAWVVHNGVAGSNSYYLLGEMTHRDEWYDGAVLGTTTSYPYMYTGAYNSDTYTPINGLASPVVGVEICYSGSYSGLYCGNIVTAVNTQVTYGDVGQTSLAFVTVNNAGTKTVGQGDSGGPGYVLVSTADGYKRYAAALEACLSKGRRAGAKPRRLEVLAARSVDAAGGRRGRNAFTLRVTGTCQCVLRVTRSLALEASWRAVGELRALTERSVRSHVAMAFRVRLGIRRVQPR